MPIDENWFENERLHRAAADGDLEEMRRLLTAGYRVDLFDDLGRAPLHYAIEGEHRRAVEWLVLQGANVNANDDATIGETPLALAVQRDYPEMVELLPTSNAVLHHLARVCLVARPRDAGCRRYRVRATNCLRVPVCVAH